MLAALAHKKIARLSPMAARMASALWYLDPAPVESAKGYETVLRGIAVADGTTQFVEVEAHPDSRCALPLNQVWAEAMQAIGRARLVHRGADNTCRHRQLDERGWASGRKDLLGSVMDRAYAGQPALTTSVQVAKARAAR